MKKQLQLTQAEASIWDWAVDAARDYWADDEGRDDGKHFDECPVEYTKNGIAVFEDDPDVIEDMEYRINEQLRDMISEQGGCDSAGRWDAERMNALKDIPTINRIMRKLAAA